MKNLIYLLVFIAFFTSCSNDDNASIVLVEEDYPTSAEFKAIFNNALENRIQSFEFTANTGNVSFTTEKGVFVLLNSDCIVDSNGDDVSGLVEVDFIEIFDKGDMLVTNKPTMGLMEDGVSKSILRSGGEFFIELTQNGEILSTTCNYTMQIPTNLTDDPTPDMTLWLGAVDENDNLTWVENETNNAGVGFEGGVYYLFFNEFNWCNVDIFYSSPDPKTTIYVDAPDGYDSTNSAIFLSYDNYIDNGLAFLDIYDEDLNLFSEHYGQIPIGLELHVIFISESDGAYLYAILPETIEEDEIINITEDQLNVATEEELIALINALP